MRQSGDRLLSYGCLVVSIVIYLYTEMTVNHCEHEGFSNEEASQGDTVKRKRVLVTGAAGFIGFHLALRLARDGHLVVAIDNFNDYYDVRLKMDRAYELSAAGVRVYRGDVCAAPLLRALFALHRPTHVVHLAAQAGVRYSLHHPLAYVRSNVQCYMTLLEMLRRHPLVRLVYASSSSVYGKHAAVPFRLSSPVDRPGNMYAATKVTDELLSAHYCAAYGVRSVGVRFFTVYGPWGRPDMAIYKFATAMAEGKPVPLFHVSDSLPLERDFTYIDDIVNGVMASLDYVPHSCSETFNLGHGAPVSVPAMLQLLERQLNVKARISKLPLPPTEILKTWADTSVSAERLDFHAKVNLKQGVKMFVEWFSNYRGVMSVNQSRRAAVDAWYQKLLANQTKLYETYASGDAVDDQMWLQEKMYEEERSRRDAPILYPETDAATNIHFNKAEVDTCLTVWNECPPHTLCVMTSPRVHRCVCRGGRHWRAPLCLPPSTTRATDLLDLCRVVNVTAMKRGKTMHFFPGVESPGGDYMLAASPHLQPDELQQACHRDPLCVAITTEGMMKKRVARMDKWRPIAVRKNSPSMKGTPENNGIFVYDINYCLLDDDACPDGATCQLVSPADSRCRCVSPSVMRAGECLLPL